MQLRYYQRDAINAVIECLKHDSINPCVEIPTGGGKTPIIATLCHIFRNYKTLVVANRKELLEQTFRSIEKWSPDTSVSLVSAGLGSKDYSGAVVVAGIQSIYSNADKLGKVDFVIVDEAHLIPAPQENEGGMYHTLINDLRSFNPNVRVIGLTATPYRLSSGAVCGIDHILNKIVYRVSVSELISGGFLTKLHSKAPIDASTDDLHIKHGEFDSQEVDAAFNTDDVVYKACSQIAHICKNRKSVLLFCCSVDHVGRVASTLHRITGDEVGVITGNSKTRERDELIKRFKGERIDLIAETKPLKWLANIDVLTTGFDAPNVDAIALLRPTASPGLFYQMCGRGFRIADGKDDCLILDFAGNLKLHGPVDAIEAPNEKRKGKREPKNKTCPVCYESIPIQARSCPSCGTKLLCDDFLCPSCDAAVDRSAFFCPSCGFQLRQRHSGDYDHVHSILSTNPLIEEKVVKTEYVIHRAKSGVDCLMVAYNTPYTRICEFVCFDHKGYARQKAARWWQERSTIFPVPVSTKQAWKIIDAYGIGEPTTIEYLPATPKDKYPRLQSCQVEPKRYDFHVSPTANPLGVVCECGCESFIYEHGASYRVICAKCGTCVLDSEVDDFDVRRVEFIESWENEFYSDEIPF